MRHHSKYFFPCLSIPEPAPRTRRPTSSAALSTHLSQICTLNISLPNCTLGDVVSNNLDGNKGTNSNSLASAYRNNGIYDDKSIKDDISDNFTLSRQTTSRAIGIAFVNPSKSYKDEDDSERRYRLRVMDSLLLLAAEYIDSSYTQLYSIFPCLRSTLVQLCDGSSTWCWAEIYFYSLMRLVDTSMIAKKARQGKGAQRNHAPLSSSRTAFLVSLACFLASQMSQFNPEIEPDLADTFVRSIIPTLVELTQLQLDVCDTPGLTLMYIFLRINVPLNMLVHESSLNYSNLPKTRTDDTSLSSLVNIPERSLNIYHPTTIIRKTSINENANYYNNEGTLIQDEEDLVPTFSCVNEVSTRSETYIFRFLKVFWIRCAALGYLRRNRPKEEIQLFGFTLKGHPNTKLEGDKNFWKTYQQLVSDNYNSEHNSIIRELYTTIFKISPPLCVFFISIFISLTFINSSFLLSNYPGKLQEYPSIRITSLMTELFRLIQNSLIRLLPKHGQPELVMLNLMDIPKTAAFQRSSGDFGILKNHTSNDCLSKRGLVGCSLFSLKKVFRSKEAWVLDRFLFYVGSSVLYP